MFVFGYFFELRSFSRVDVGGCLVDVFVGCCEVSVWSRYVRLFCELDGSFFVENFLLDEVGLVGGNGGE